MTIAYPYEPDDEAMICLFSDGDLYCVLEAGHNEDHSLALYTGSEND